MDEELPSVSFNWQLQPCLAPEQCTEWAHLGSTQKLFTEAQNVTFSKYSTLTDLSQKNSKKRGLYIWNLTSDGTSVSQENKRNASASCISPGSTSNLQPQTAPAKQAKIHS